MRKLFATLLAVVSLAIGQVGNTYAGKPGVLRHLTITEWLDADSAQVDRATVDTMTVSTLADFDGVVDFTGATVEPAQYGVAGVLSAEDSTTVTIGGTYYAINGTFTNDPIQSFTYVSGPPPGLRYDGAETRYFEVDWSATVSGDSNRITCFIGVGVNGTSPEITNPMEHFLRTAGEPQSFSGTTVIELNTDDVVTLVVSADDNGDVLTFHTMTTTIRPFYCF